MKENIFRQLIKAFIVLVISLGSLISGVAFLKAQEVSKISIGDKAPPLVYSSWIKGDPIAKFSSDKIYVFEFWATWCAPCIASMPHLSELAQKYKDNVVVIAVDASERIVDKQPYSSTVPLVSKFVEKNKEKMKFDVVLDNDERGMDRNWLKAAQVSGIPATFVVQNNIIQWIGHPQNLETILKMLVDKKYDILKHKSAYEAARKKDLNSSSEYSANITKIDSLLRLKQVDKAMKLTDYLVKNEEKFAPSYGLKMLQILIANSEVNDVVAYLNKVKKENPAWILRYSIFISRQTSLKKEIYQQAIGALETLDPMNDFNLDVIAKLQSLVGDYRKAMVNQQKALDMLRESNLKQPGSIPVAIIKLYEKKVEDYRISAGL